MPGWTGRWGLIRLWMMVTTVEFLGLRTFWSSLWPGHIALGPAALALFQLFLAAGATAYCMILLGLILHVQRLQRSQTGKQ